MRLFLLAWLLTGLWHTFKPLPEGMHVRGTVVDTPLADVQLLIDLTTADAFGAPLVRQQIFDEVIALIGRAREYLVVDFFLFNSQRGSALETAPHRALSSQIRDALLARKRELPQLRVLVITDPINDVYGALPSSDLAALRGAGIDVVRVDLDRLRDSNPVYSSAWRLLVGWWASEGPGDNWLPNPLDDGPDRVSFGAWARLLNFKANHRKVVIGDDGRGGITGIVASANAHDASSAHSNVAARISGAALMPLLESELAVARFSGWQGDWPAPTPNYPPTPPVDAPRARVQVLTEGEIESAVLRNLADTGAGDFIDVAMFYLSERDVIRALVAAAQRGAIVRVILDPNKDAFGRTKSGIPNRPVATELGTSSDGAVKIRWYRTHGEQFHTKLIAVRRSQEMWFTVGSANMTRRNIDDYNLEANIGVTVPANAPVASQITTYFDDLWNNRGAPEREYTAEYGAYADPAQSTYWLYRLMEATGLSTF